MWPRDRRQDYTRERPRNLQDFKRKREDDKRCRLCSELGHFAKECPYKEKVQELQAQTKPAPKTG
jgi:hypothetical protein